MDFIIVPRSIFESDAFEKEPYSKREAFLDLVQMAAFERKEVFVAGHKYIAERGQVLVSKSFLVQRWGWNVDKVRRYLQYLERNHRCYVTCDHQCNQPITCISIVSYDSYQGGATTNTTTDNTTTATTDTTQYKEIITNKEKEKKSSSIYAEAVERIYALYPPKTVRPEGNSVSLKSAKKDKDKVLRMLKSGEYTEESLTYAINRYIAETKSEYLKVFQSFLNSIPDYSDPGQEATIFSQGEEREWPNGLKPQKV